MKFLTNRTTRGQRVAACHGHYSGKITLTWIGEAVLHLMGLVLEEPRAVPSKRTRVVIRIIDDSFPAYDRECLIGRNGVKSRASCRASFCHRQREDRSIADTLPPRNNRMRLLARPSLRKYSLTIATYILSLINDNDWPPGICHVSLRCAS